VEILHANFITRLLTDEPGQQYTWVFVYAFVAGKVIVSTTFLHTQELLGDGRGMFCQFRSPPSIAKSIATLREDEALIMEVKEKAYEYEV
jgi:hypothetical protein